MYALNTCLLQMPSPFCFKYMSYCDEVVGVTNSGFSSFKYDFEFEYYILKKI